MQDRSSFFEVSCLRGFVIVSLSELVGVNQQRRFTTNIHFTTVLFSDFSFQEDNSLLYKFFPFIKKKLAIVF